MSVHLFSTPVPTMDSRHTNTCTIYAHIIHKTIDIDKQSDKVHHRQMFALYHAHWVTNLMSHVYTF